MANEPILIVDDNPINLKLLKVLMTIEGYNVRTAMDADEVMQILKEFKPDLILMDIQLPGMDGYELTQKLKSDPKHKNTIILAVTAYAMKGDDEKAATSGCDGYIAKPIDTQKFPSTIADFLGKKKKYD
ncbi:TPA: response regulator [Legionella pneumophila]|nr:response regulator [Legionella pneumophila]HAT8181058.1 response regulator [Legionella pneumophila]